jgi:hypothetical protein
MPGVHVYGPGNAFNVESAVFIKIFVLYGYRGVFEVLRLVFTLYRDAFNGVIILPQQVLAAAIVITNAAAQVAARA